MTRENRRFIGRALGAGHTLISTVKRGDLAAFDPKFEVDAPLVGALLRTTQFQDGLRAIADAAGRRYEDLLAQAEDYLREMSAIHNISVTTWWDRFGTWVLRGYELVVDIDGLRGLRPLDHDHSLVFLQSHRSYLDEWAFPGSVHAAGINRLWSFMGANLDYFPMGAIARRVGMIHVRRAIRGNEVYKHALRSYIGHLVSDRVNLMWSIEGGRTRTGKLRPPRLGLLRFLVDSVDALDTPEVYIVPASMLYDQIPANEVRVMTLEALGGIKRPENARWFLNYISQLNSRMGRVYVNVGEPLALRERLAELRAEDPSGRTVVERLGVDVSHRINQATPVTATAAVCIALLGAGRALTLTEVLATIRPLADYLDLRGWPTAGGVNLRDRASIRSALKSLVDTNVLDAYDADETVWSIAPTQHLTAANYRNSAIHVLLEPAIAEVSLMGVMMSENPTHDAYAEAGRLRDLLKFEFFFSRGAEFAARLCREIGVELQDPDFSPVMTPQRAEEYFDRLAIHVSVLVLRPFLDAYAVVAHELARVPPTRDIEESKFLEHCLAVGKQWVLRRLVASDESNSLEMFRNAYQLAGHRGLLDPDSPELADRRVAFHNEIEAYRRFIDAIAERLRTNDALVPPEGAAASP